mmetsp:Transcript_20235/g.50381  ORF Transcript_20235/g.50381 Transcript_20235/m.50381 type:complete len:250 (+) Transcript_20235:1319-2068(+)
MKRRRRRERKSELRRRMKRTPRCHRMAPRRLSTWLISWRRLIRPMARRKISHRPPLLPPPPQDLIRLSLAPTQRQTRRWQPRPTWCWRSGTTTTRPPRWRRAAALAVAMAGPRGLRRRDPSYMRRPTGERLGKWGLRRKGRTRRTRLSIPPPPRPPLPPRSQTKRWRDIRPIVAQIAALSARWWACATSPAFPSASPSVRCSQRVCCHSWRPRRRVRVTGRAWSWTPARRLTRQRRRRLSRRHTLGRRQ